VVPWNYPSCTNPCLGAPGNVWVVSQDDASIRILKGSDLSHVGIIPLPMGSRPYGIAFDPNNASPYAYVTYEGTGKLAKVDTQAAIDLYGYPTGTAVVATLDVGGPNSRPRGIAIMKPNS